MLYPSRKHSQIIQLQKRRKSWTILSKQTYLVTPVSLKTPAGVCIETASSTVNSCIQTHYSFVFLVLVLVVCWVLVVATFVVTFWWCWWWCYMGLLVGTIIHLVDCLYDVFMDEESATA